MDWQLTRGQNARLVYSDPDSGRTISKIFRTGNVARFAVQNLIDQRNKNQRALLESQNTESKLNQLESLVELIIRQHLICCGGIFRNHRWQLVSRLQHQLTPVEKNLIRRTWSNVFPDSPMNGMPLLSEGPMSQARKDQSNPIGELGELLQQSDTQKSEPKPTMNSPRDSLDALSCRPQLNDNEISEVRNLLAVDPRLWREYGDITEWTRDHALASLDTHTVEYECIRKGLDELRTNLLREGNSPLEVVAIDQVITNHLQVARSGAELEQIHPSKELAAVSNHWIRVHNHAQTRLFRAINTLNRLRKTNLDSFVVKCKNRHIDFDAKITEQSHDSNTAPDSKKSTQNEKN